MLSFNLSPPRKPAAVDEDGQRRRLSVVPLGKPQIEYVPLVRTIFDVCVGWGNFVLGDLLLPLAPLGQIGSGFVFGEHPHLYSHQPRDTAATLASAWRVFGSLLRKKMWQADAKVRHGHADR